MVNIPVPWIRNGSYKRKGDEDSRRVLVVFSLLVPEASAPLAYDAAAVVAEPFERPTTECFKWRTENHHVGECVFCCLVKMQV